MKAILILLLVISGSLFAQTNSTFQAKYYLNRIKHFKLEDPLMYEKDMFNTIKGTEVRKITKSIQYKNKKKKVSTFELNEHQRPIALTTSTGTLTMTYFQDTLVSSLNVDGKKPKKTSYRYEDSKLIFSETLDNNERLLSRTTVQYNDHGNTSFASVQGKRGKTFSMYYEYSEDEPNRVKYQRFMKKDRIKQTWDYTCAPEGQTEQQKRESTVCNFQEENADGSYVKHVRKLEGGEVSLYKYFFTADSTMYRTESWRDDQMRWETDITPSQRVQTNYHKGEVSSVYTTRFNDNGNVLEQIHLWNPKTGKKSVRKYSYDAEGKLLTITSFYKEKVRSEVSYEYSM